MNKCVLEIWEREFELDVIYERYPGEKVSESQRAAFEQLCTAVIDDALDHVKKYVKDTATLHMGSPLDNIFKYVMPKSVFVPRGRESTKVAIICNYKFDAEHGIAIIFENGKYKEIGTQDIVL